MATTSAGTFLHSLRESRLLEPAQIDELTATPDAENTEPHVLAQCLVEMGWLTPFQVDHLLAGRLHDLTFGNYQLLDRLGQSDVGSTFKARRPGKPGVVTLKVVPKTRLATPEATAKFMQDVRTAAQLQYEHITPLLTVGQVGSNYLCARTYVEGTDLDKLVHESGPLSSAQACTATRQAALALEYAADKGLFHGRVKPSNLIAITPAADGEGLSVRVVDFGLAQLAKSPSHAADLHGLGHTLLFLLTGKTLAELANDPEALATLPPDVLAVMEKLAADRPEDGYASASAAAAALEPLCREPVPEPEPPVTVPVDVIAASLVVPSNGTAPSSGLTEAEAGLPVAMPYTDTAAAIHEPVDIPMAVAVFEAAAPAVEPIAAVATVPFAEEPVPVSTISAPPESMPAPAVEISPASPPPPMPAEPIPLEGIAVPIDAIAVVAPVPVDAEVPAPEPIIAAADPEPPLALATAVVGEPAPTEEFPAVPMVAAVTESASSEVPPVSPITVSSEPVPDDIPTATAIASVGEPVAVPEPTINEAPDEIPLGSIVAPVSEAAPPEPAVVPLIDTAPVPTVEAPPPLPELMPMPAAAPETPPAAPPEPVVPSLELTETKPEPTPGPGYATSFPCEAPPLPGPEITTSIPSEAPPAEAPAPPQDAFSQTLPETPAYQPPVDPFAGDATTAEVGALAGGPARLPDKRKKKKFSFSLKNLSKTQLLWLVIGGILNLVVAPILIYFIVMQLTSDPPQQKKQAPPRRAAPNKAG
jgi:hypothetical protein